MVIGIIGAMNEEIVSLIDMMKDKREILKFNISYHIGEINGKDIIVVKSGIGKVNATICTSILIECFKPDFLINVGVAGGLFDELIPGDIVIGKDLVQYDVDATCFGYKKGQVPGIPVVYFKADDSFIEKSVISASYLKNVKVLQGTIVTGDRFINSKEEVEYLKNEFQGYACDMEGAAIAQTCFILNVPFVIIKSVSDNASTGARMEYDKFKQIAIKNSLTIISRLLSIV